MDWIFKLAMGAEKQFKLFRKCVPQQITMQEILRVTGDLRDDACLDVGLDNGVMSHYLRRHGGQWQTVVSDGRALSVAREVLGEGVQTMEGGKIPFEAKRFDVVVMADCLEQSENDEEIVRECHRVLNTEGVLVLAVERAKKFSIINILRSLIGDPLSIRGKPRRYYTEARLFAVLKHGFDVHHVRSHTRFFVTLTDFIVNSVLRGLDPEDPMSEQRVMRVMSIAGPFYWLSHQLDMFLFFTKGFKQIAVAKRRAWRERNAPVLNDGRSITEAVLSHVRK